MRSNTNTFLKKTKNASDSLEHFPLTPFFRPSHIESFVEFSGSWKSHETGDFCSQSVANFHPCGPSQPKEDSVKTVK